MTKQEAIKQIKHNSTWYLILGILLIILGTAALFYAFYSTIFSVIYLGTVVVALGVFEVVTAFKLDRWGSFFLRIALGILAIASGIFIIAYPALNAITLTLLLAAYLIASGIFKIYFSIVSNIPHRFWLTLNGVLSIILGGLIWAQWPTSGLWVLGMLLGIDAIFTGWTWIMLSLKAKELTHS